MTRQTEQTEVVKIRLGSSEKAALDAVAERECRTFAAQVRMAVREWLEGKSARPVRGTAASTKETASTANNSAMVPCQHKFFSSTEFGFVECRYCGATYPIEAQHQ